MPDELDEEIYKENILDHYKNPRNFRGLESCTICHKDTNPLCGDRVEIFADLTPDGDTLTTLTFQGSGCAISQAATSMLTEILPGKSVAEIQALGRDDILALLGITIGVARMKCAMLGLRTLQKGLALQLNSSK